jgi:hypothetical protein
LIYRKGALSLTLFNPVADTDLFKAEIDELRGERE